jgi:hypothetical protein
VRRDPFVLALLSAVVLVTVSLVMGTCLGLVQVRGCEGRSERAGEVQR